eukprot:TRINITY_DN2501_c0_g1_i1.p1 TRINITY_DN2501_c0_g1~~TRINITY_DN2501_c0_g1_i1.p1  ORF type:complete len:315 (+),score=19.67 TRINITY_DN2501_c0_g1_i1:32-946(+)
MAELLSAPYTLTDHHEGNVYILSEFLGQGQTGVVHTCHHVNTGKVLACKSISRLHIQKHASQVMKEIAVLMKVGRHDHIVQLQNIFNDDYGVHILTNFCSGGDLFSFLSCNGKLPERIAASLIRQILLGLSHIHSLGLVHRDLKPENILMTRRVQVEMDTYGSTDPSTDISKEQHFQVQIADFGFAIDLNNCYSSKTTGFYGSTYYMAPEIVSGTPYGTEADLWSLGVICFVFLTGRMPFPARMKCGSYEETNLKLKEVFLDPDWLEITQCGRDFLCGLLCHSQKRRMSAACALSHPWITCRNA